jgi:Ca-activated chloride channel family protein
VTAPVKSTRPRREADKGLTPLRRRPLPAPSRPAAPAASRTALRVLGLLALTLVAALGALVYPYIAKGWRVWVEAEWRHPWVLFGLVLVPIAWWWGTFGQDRRRPRLLIGTLAPLVRAPRGVRVRLRDLPAVLRAVALALLALALARPIQVLSDQTSDEKGIDIVIIMDLSGSMQAVLDADPKDLPGPLELPRNVRPTRLDVAKLVVEDFIARRKTDRIGVIVFGKSAYILSPPTLDYPLLSQLVRGLSLSVIDGSKTAIGDALGTGVARLRRSDALSKVIILFTDGDNNAGKVSPEYAIEMANTVGAKTYTIQIGDSAEVDVLQGFDPIFGQPQYVRRRYPTNPELLRKIAQQTGAEAFVATDAKALKESMHSILDQLEKTRFEASVAHHEELFRFLLIPGVVLIGLEALLRALLLRRFP